MKESTLLKIALVIALVGVIILFFISDEVKIDEKTIDQLDGVDENVLVKGIVTRITELETVSFIEITQENKITVVLFKDYPIDLKEGEVVEVLGKTEEYKGEFEIIGKEVRVVE